MVNRKPKSSIRNQSLISVSKPNRTETENWKTDRTENRKITNRSSPRNHYYKVNKNHNSNNVGRPKNDPLIGLIVHATHTSNWSEAFDL